MRRSLLHEQHGIALPLMLSVLLLVSLLAAGALGSALATTSSSQTDTRAVRALAAANAGVDAAITRLNGVAPAPTDTQCLTTVAVPATAGECPATPGQSLGNGASFSYTVSVSQTGAGCAALPGAPAGAYRCVTSTGIVDGVRRRVQVRVAGGTPGASGLIALNKVLFNNSVTARSCGPQPPRIGSNNQIQFNNSTTLYPVLQTGAGCSGAQWAVEYPAGTSFNPGTSYSPNPMVQVVRPTPWEIPAVDFTSSRTSNNNGALTGAGWNATTRALTVPNGGDRTLLPGTYNFCSLTVPNGKSISMPSGATAGNVVRIFIDSPERPGSDCPVNSGRLDLLNSVNFNAPDGASDAELTTRAKNLEVYVWGNSALNRGSGQPADCGDSPRKANQEVVLCNSVKFAGQIHGPAAEVLLNNSITFTGSVAAYDITLWNSVSFFRPAGLGVLGASNAVTQQAFAQCSGTAPSATDPESGCGS